MSKVEKLVQEIDDLNSNLTKKRKDLEEELKKENKPLFFEELLKIFNMNGGTIHQVLDKIKEVKNRADMIEECSLCQGSGRIDYGYNEVGDCMHCEGRGYVFIPF